MEVKGVEENGMESNFDVEACLYLNGRSARACEKKRRVERERGGREEEKENGGEEETER